MSESNNQPMWAQVLVAFLPVFFGSFLFVGVLENYKNDSQLGGQIIENSFIPMRELQGSCHNSHNELSLQYGNLSGAYQLMLNELEHLFSTPESELGMDYEILSKSVFETYSETNRKVDELKDFVSNCRLELFRKYEELALMTSTYETFFDMANNKADSINEVYEERYDLSQTARKDIEAIDLMAMMRDLLSTQLMSNSDKEDLMNNMRKIAPIVIEHNQNMMNTEQKMFNIHIEFDNNLRTLFAGKISDMYDEGFLGWVF